MDLNSNLSSTLDLISIPVAKQRVLPYKEAILFSWGPADFSIWSKEYISQQMRIFIEEDRTCDERYNAKTYRNFIKKRQICGSPLNVEQHVTSVIKLITPIITFVICLSSNFLQN